MIEDCAKGFWHAAISYGKMIVDKGNILACPFAAAMCRGPFQLYSFFTTGSSSLSDTFSLLQSSSARALNSGRLSVRAKYSRSSISSSESDGGIVAAGLGGTFDESLKSGDLLNFFGVTGLLVGPYRYRWTGIFVAAKRA